MLQPLISDYKQAVLDAANSFKDLLPIEAVQVNAEPKFATGNFAVVFQMRKTDSNKLMAVKCFHRHLSDRQVRQQHIAAYLGKNKPKYFVPYRYLPEELWIDTGNHAQDYAVVAMDWVEGKTLGETVKNHCKAQNKEALSQLADKFCEMASYLLTLPIAHGDLKHDNILVTPAGELVLVDYDGMYVPALQGHEAAELGGTDYQHPQRKGTDYNATIDDYSIAIIALSLAALAQQPELYELQKGENLLLARQDILNPFASEILPKIEDIDNKTVQKLLNLVKNAVMGQSIEVKGLKIIIEIINISNPKLVIKYCSDIKFETLQNFAEYVFEEFKNVDKTKQFNVKELAKELYEDLKKYNKSNNEELTKKILLLVGNITRIVALLEIRLNPTEQINKEVLDYIAGRNLQTENDLKRIYATNNNQIENISKFLDISITNQNIVLKTTECPLTVEWWDGLMQYGNLQEIGLRQYDWQHIIRLHLAFWEIEILLNNDFIDKKCDWYNRNCFNLFEQEFQGTFVINLPQINQQLLIKAYEINSFWLYKCGIATLEPLRNLKNLQVLNCTHNQINNLEPLRELKNLQKLSCGFNTINSLEPLRELINLQELYCYGNQISSLEPLGELKNLQILNCTHNQVSSSEIEQFKEKHPNCKVN